MFINLKQYFEEPVALIGHGGFQRGVRRVTGASTLLTANACVAWATERTALVFRSALF